MMNRHEFAHVLSMVHGEMRRCMQLLPMVMVKERKFAEKIKNEIDEFMILPEEILTEKESKNGMAE